MVKAEFICIPSTLLVGVPLINISHRTTFEELLKKPFTEAAVFRPATPIQKKTFKEYVRYFQRKKRCGVINLHNYILYLAPKCRAMQKVWLLLPEPFRVGKSLAATADTIWSS